MNTKFASVTRSCAFVILFATMFGCSGDYSKELPNLYRLVKTQPGRVLISSPHAGISVMPHITSFDVRGVHVVGTIERSGVAAVPPQLEKSRFFILDTTNGADVEFDSSKEFQKRCREVGILDALQFKKT